MGSPSILPQGITLVFLGAGDSAQQVGGGPPFRSNGYGTTRFSFIDPIWLVGGEVRWADATFGDSVTLTLEASTGSPVPAGPGGTLAWSCPGDVGPGRLVPGSGWIEAPTDLVLARFAQFHLVGSGRRDANVAMVQPMLIVPGWELVVTVDGNGAGPKVAWDLICGRARTI